jgi:hypothetical protein
MDPWTRFRRALATQPAVIGWLLLAWTVMANASTAQFVWAVGRAATHWLDSHSWVGSAVGCGLIAAAVFWPDLLRKFPWLSAKPRTLRDEVNDVRALTGKTLDLHSESFELYRKTTADFYEHRMKSIREISELSGRITSEIGTLRSDLGQVKNAVLGLEIRLNEHRDWMADLERRLDRS